MKTKKVVIKLIISLGLIWYLAAKFDFEQTKAILVQTSPGYFVLMLACIGANYFVSSYRWKQLLVFDSEKTIGLGFLVKLYFIGSFFNNFMPTSIGGDVYKVYRLTKKVGNLEHAFAATFMERFTGVLVLVLLSYVGLWQRWDVILGLAPTWVAENSRYALLVKVGLLAGFWLASAAAFLALRFLHKKLAFLAKIYNALLVYFRVRKTLGVVIGAAFVVQLFSIASQYLTFLALGYTPNVGYAFFVFPIITLASFFIPSLNGLGVQDVLFIKFFEVYHVAPELALSASILYHGARLLTSLVGGVLYAFEEVAPK